MIRTDTLARAQRVPKDRFDRDLALLTSARKEAARLINAAKTEAEDMRVAALAEAKNLQEQIESQQQKFNAETQNAKADLCAARESVGVLIQAAKMRAVFDTAETWLVPLIAAALHKIVGQLDASELIAAQVNEAVGEIAATQDLTLRVSRSDAATLACAMEQYPDHFAGVSAVTTDATLPEGTVHLEDLGGFVDISLSAQIETLCEQLQAMPVDVETMA